MTRSQPSHHLTPNSLPLYESNYTHQLAIDKNFILGWSGWVSKPQQRANVASGCTRAALPIELPGQISTTHKDNQHKKTIVVTLNMVGRLPASVLPLPVHDSGGTLSFCTSGGRLSELQPCQMKGCFVFLTAPGVPGAAVGGYSAYLPAPLALGLHHLDSGPLWAGYFPKFCLKEQPWFSSPTTRSRVVPGG